MQILILNGPNLNLLGTREPDIYGTQTMDDVLKVLRAQFAPTALNLIQSNHEGHIINGLHRPEDDAVVLNAGALAHYSYAIADAIRAVNKPVIEVHISNTAARESFRHHSVLTAACVGSITGLGTAGYALAIRYLLGQA